MDPERAREDAERDQLWASLRPLLPMIDQLAQVPPEAGNPHAQLIVVLARVVAAEIRYRERTTNPDGNP